MTPDDRRALLGLEALRATLARLSGRTVLRGLMGGPFGKVARELHQIHEEIMTEAKRRTPVRWGILKASGHVQPPEIVGSSLVSQGGFGGPAAPYAVYVHEILTAHHHVGRAKFYESPLLEAIPTMEARLGKAAGQAVRVTVERP